MWCDSSRSCLQPDFRNVAFTSTKYVHISTCAHGFISTFSNNSQLNFSAVPSCSHFAGVAELMHIDLTPYDETNGAPDGCQNMFRTGENAGTGLLQ